MNTSNKYGLVYDLFESIAVFDKNNHISFAGQKISSDLKEYGIELDKISQKNKTDKKSKELIDSINRSRENNEHVLFSYDDSQDELVLLPINSAEKGTIFLSDKGSLDYISKMEQNLKGSLKELSCLYNITHELQNAKTIDEAFQKCTEHIKNGYQFPEITTVVIEFNRKKFISSGGSEENVANLMTDENILKDFKPNGKIKVIYHKKYPFLKEEFKLIKEISQKFTKAIEKEERTELLEKQKKKLLSKNKILLRLTQECRISREQLQTFFRAITDKIIVIDKDHNIITSNSNEIGNTGKCYSNVFGFDHICPHCKAHLTFGSSKMNTTEIEFDNKYYNLNDYPIFDNEGQVDRILEVCHDVTKEKEMETQLIETHKFASLGALVAGVAHEINNPNTFILGNIKIVKEAFEDIIPILDEKYADDPKLKIARLNYNIFKENISLLIDDINRGSVRIMKIVEDLRAYAKKDNDIFSDKVDINNLIENIIRLINKEVKDNIKVVLNLNPKVPEFNANISKLEQVFVNMILNAVQAIGEEQGEIIISTKHDNNHNIKISIQDNGKGMDEAVRRNIFDPFFTTKRHEGGTGLGLSISYKIIKVYKGTIDVDSKLGKGTTFTITLPIFNLRDDKNTDN